MEKRVLSREELIRLTQVSESIIGQLEKLGVISPSGITEDEKPFYLRDSLQHITQVKKLLELGYGPEEIAKIQRKVGLPDDQTAIRKSGSVKKHLTVGGLAEKVGVSPRTIKHWEEVGIIDADMRSEGGFRLYSEIYVYLCKLILDLQLFGYSLEEIKHISDLFRLFLRIERDINSLSKKETDKKLDAMLDEIHRLFSKINELKSGIGRWEDLLSKKSKEINQFKKRNQKRQTGQMREKKNA